MLEEDSKIIKKHFYSSNMILLYQMYFSEMCTSSSINIDKIKKYNPGHLGTSVSMNFILSNLYYYLNKRNISNKIIIGTGHSGASLSSQLWLNGTWENKDNRYSRTKEGLNNLICDFGTKIRSEINPEYPNTIYDGGELGYALGTAYGYAINSDNTLIPCIVGDGELETGTAFSSFQLNRVLKTKGKVLPIINLNGLKMGSASYLSNLSDLELNHLFSLFGYNVNIINTDNEEIINVINDFQSKLNNIEYQQFPLLIIRSKKGYSLPNVNNIIFEGNPDVHKNPLSKYETREKLLILKSFLTKYNEVIFDENGNILNVYDCFKINDKKNKIDEIIDLKEIGIDKSSSYHFSIKKLEDYLLKIINKNDMMIFSPDEIYSNQLGKLSSKTFELLNENVLQSLFQGYAHSGKTGIFIGYESFMPIISSMISQYYKYLLQCKTENIEYPPLTYILTSTCWENTYSHQNPDFVNNMFEKSDSNLYNVLYPKNGNDLITSINNSLTRRNCINIITTSKRHIENDCLNNSNNLTAEVIINNDNPNLILCATGDYMLDQILEVYKHLNETEKNIIKIVYVTNPIILKKYSNDEFYSLFNKNIPIVYLYTGYASTIKSLLFDRKIDCKVFGYNDGISAFGNLNNNFDSNNMNLYDIINNCNNKISKSKILRR